MPPPGCGLPIFRGHNFWAFCKTTSAFLPKVMDNGWSSMPARGGCRDTMGYFAGYIYIYISSTSNDIHAIHVYCDAFRSSRHSLKYIEICHFSFNLSPKQKTSHLTVEKQVPTNKISISPPTNYLKLTSPRHLFATSKPWWKAAAAWRIDGSQPGFLDEDIAVTWIFCEVVTKLNTISCSYYGRDWNLPLRKSWFYII